MRSNNCDMPTNPSHNDEINHGLRAALSHPALYILFGRMMGLSEKYRMYISRFIKPFPGMRILDIGCGPAAILNFLPVDVDYTGYDVNPSYIAYAKRKFRHRAVFYNQAVSNMTLTDPRLFDVVLADGLCHHLNDTEAANVFEIGHMNLKNNGFMLTIDPVFTKNQSKISKLITQFDRGQHVRYGEEYKQIASSYFSKIHTHIFDHVGRLPLIGCILKCMKD
jgi:cyclopropane fatty-acyl-phospholipid synthase-like methyltransferase